MLESTFEFLRCVRCGSKLELDVFKSNQEIQEGILECKKCKLLFPIVEKIPILWDDLSSYLSNHKVLGGKLFQTASTGKMKSIIKSALAKKISSDDKTTLEERWSKIYQKSTSSKFYSTIKNNLDSLPQSNLVLEHGCSIGIIASFLADSHKMVFGIDRSFTALRYAKKSYKDNLDYVVADSLSQVFGKLSFDLILALNILELIEPSELLKHVAKQITSGHLVISDPYDFDRGINSVKKPLDETTLRTNMNDLGFKISAKTKKPSYIPWNLHLNPRTTLNYKVDLVIGKK
ncbi:MAG: methyltransferase domain-containing protein [Nitrosopumilus sp.]